MKSWNQIKARFEQVKRDYGKIAIVIYIVLWASVLIIYAVAIKMGFETKIQLLSQGEWEVGVGKTGILFGAWVAAKASQPIRIVLTIVLTPFVASLLRRQPVLEE